MTIQKIKELIVASELGKALTNATLMFKGHELENIIIIIESDFNQYRKDQMKGLLTPNEASAKKNRITNRLLELLDAYEASNTAMEENPTLAEKLIKGFEQIAELSRAILSNKDEETTLNSLHQFYSSHPDIAKDFSIIEAIFSKLNEKSSANTLDEKEIAIITQSVKKSTERILEELEQHQQEAVSKAVAFSRNAVENSKRTIGYIYQASGTGLTITLLTYIYKILENDFFKNHQILLLADRINLINQFSNVLSQNKLDHFTPNSCRELVENLDTPNRQKVILSTVQKLKRVEQSTHFINKFLVIGYRSRINNINFLKLFPNAQFLLFADVPLLANDREKAEYIFTYHYKSAIENGYTIPVSYESRVFLAKINESILDGLDANIEEVKDYYKSTSFLQAVAKDIIEHFKTSRNDFNGKALILTSDRHSAILLGSLIHKLEPTWRENVAIVTADNSKSDNLQLAQDFQQKEKNPRITIVVNMLLEGYNNEFLDTLYVVRPLSSFLLWRALGRVNRKSPNKEKGLIVDYFDNFRRMEFDGF